MISRARVHGRRWVIASTASGPRKRREHAYGRRGHGQAGSIHGGHAPPGRRRDRVWRHDRRLDRRGKHGRLRRVHQRGQGNQRPRHDLGAARGHQGGGAATGGGGTGSEGCRLPSASGRRTRRHGRVPGPACQGHPQVPAGRPAVHRPVPPVVLSTSRPSRLRPGVPGCRLPVQPGQAPLPGAYRERGSSAPQGRRHPALGRRGPRPLH